ncbi:hypothetical protein PG996_007410 [Apiospora saccharicola]|uniref:Uncharacterized protein n=1 Tax=Apiospora saccharicola TaxID=335842 RepID=A0ABR1VEE5_9PEZI
MKPYPNKSAPRKSGCVRVAIKQQPLHQLDARNQILLVVCKITTATLSLRRSWECGFRRTAASRRPSMRLTDPQSFASTGVPHLSHEKKAGGSTSSS